MMRSSEDVITEAFAECLDMLMSGSPAADCYRRFPKHASELEGLLTTTALVEPLRPVPPRNPAVAAARRNEFMRAAYALHVSYNGQRRFATPTSPTSWTERLATRLLGPNSGSARQKLALFPIISYLLLIAFTGILITGATVASAGALPGDLFYPIKTARENVQVYFTRDVTERAELEVTFQERRIGEIKAVLERGRVTTLPLRGVIEQISGSVWVVSGLRITLTADTIIEGQPEVGARVEGRVRAPGDRSLIALRIEVTEQAESRILVADTPTPLPTARPATATRAPPTMTPKPAPTGEVVQSAVVILPTIPIFEPVEPSVTPTLQPTATPTHTATPTRRPQPTLTRAPTQTPVNRGRITGMVSGTVKAIDGSRWLINEVWVETFAGTRYGGNPRVDGHVDVFYEIRDGLLPLALEIIERNIPPTIYYAVTGTVTQVGDVWTIVFDNGDSASFRVTAETQFENGQAGAGDTVTVEIEDGPGGRIALKITRINRDEVVVTGPIEKMDPGLWIIGGRSVIVTGSTLIRGTPVIGAIAQAVGYESPDGSSLIAREITIE